MKKKDKVLQRWVIENAFNNNPHGAGFLAWDHENNELVCKKGFFTLRSFLQAFNPYKRNLSVLHFRIATHGKRNKENCHPFLINENVGFAHNGIIHNVGMYDRKFSDTWHLCERILKPMIKNYPDIWTNSTFKFLLSQFISKNSKLVFLDNTGRYEIVNKSRGVWDSGCWFSNNSYLKVAPCADLPEGGVYDKNMAVRRPNKFKAVVEKDRKKTRLGHEYISTAICNRS